ncbi:hypothetical protein CDAR_472211 [Caerostris darwini]|uniref:Uncharacterized protein n=1 Tax=Caerostris darwini TaxID=1538125 RepID=A0AAV4VMG7_9ARAC|nr:hypothetical protein CDAR_472211 [Caerostris darwini]
MSEEGPACDSSPFRVREARCPTHPVGPRPNDRGLAFYSVARGPKNAGPGQSDTRAQQTRVNCNWICNSEGRAVEWSLGGSFRVPPTPHGPFFFGGKGEMKHHKKCLSER